VQSQQRAGGDGHVGYSAAVPGERSLCQVFLPATSRRDVGQDGSKAQLMAVNVAIATHQPAEQETDRRSCTDRGQGTLSNDIQGSV
jgi:hypothetical protein